MIWAGLMTIRSGKIDLCEYDVERFFSMTERKILDHRNDYWSYLSASYNDAVQW
jgi:hypothetical protein